MVEYKVQCIDINGLPYGRYVNPNSKLHGILQQLNEHWCKFESLADANTFPFPAGTIGKIYEREEVEGPIQQIWYNYKWLSQDHTGRRFPADTYRMVFILKQC